MIDPQDTFKRRREEVLGRRITYVEEGRGPTAVLLSGTGIHSYYWRNLIRFLGHGFRCIAPDWLGTGESDVRYPSGDATYRFSDRALDLDAFLDVVGVDGPMVLIGQELGALHCLHWARRHPRRVRSVILLEGVFRTTNTDSWDPDVRELVEKLRTPEVGEHLALQENAIVERYLPMLTKRMLTKLEMDRYRAPYPVAGEARRAPLSMIRDLPIRQDPGPLDDRAEELRRWAAQSRIPKLVIGGTPGFLTPQHVIASCAKWEATEVALVPGIHYLMEDSPARITATIQEFLSRV